MFTPVHSARGGAHFNFKLPMKGRGVGGKDLHRDLACNFRGAKQNETRRVQYSLSPAEMPEFDYLV